MGFTASTQDLCLLYNKIFLVIMYVADVRAAAPSSAIIDYFVTKLKSHGYELTKEGKFSEYLAIKFEEDSATGTITLTQKGLIQKILAATGMINCNPNHHPAATAAFGIDPDS